MYNIYIYIYKPKDNIYMKSSFPKRDREFEGKMWEARIFSDPAIPDHMWQVKNTYVMCSGKTHHMVKFYQFHTFLFHSLSVTKDRII